MTITPRGNEGCVWVLAIIVFIFFWALQVAGLSCKGVMELSLFFCD